jgi:N-acetylmuramic acid 6-phosphate etherase
MSIASTETRHADAAGLQDRAPEAALALLLAAQQAAAAAVAPAIPALARAAEVIADALAAGHRAIYAGAGSAGVMALADALELPGTFGIAPDRVPVLLAGGAAALLHMRGAVEDDAAAAQADLARLAPVPGDVLVAVSASGTTPYTLAVARGARARGLTTIAIANVAASPLLAEAAIAVLLDSGAEVVAGSTRMGAGTAQKIALNMVSTLAALRLGHVHDGLMVNLAADNAKLRDRAARIVAGIAAVAPERAQAALERAGGAVKPAVLIAAGARDAAHADDLLAASGGRLGPALAALNG